MLKLNVFILSFLVIVPAFASSLFDRTVNGRPLFDIIKEQGVPEAAIRRVFEFIDINSDKKFLVKSEDGKTLISLDNQDHAAIIDFSKISTEKRLYYIDLRDGMVEKHYVAHGMNTGDNEARRFSNIEESKMSSLGIYVTGKTYDGKYGESLALYGTEKSNDLAHTRHIVIHPAEYVSQDFIDKNGRLGRSFGCPALDFPVAKRLIPQLKDGAVVYAYHPDLMAAALTGATVKVMGSN